MIYSAFEHYMRAEFEFAPEALRECMSFYVKVSDEQLDCVLLNISCPLCKKPAVCRGDAPECRVECTHCGHSQKDLSKTPRLASAAWIDQKDYDLTEFNNPWVKADVMTKKYAAFISGGPLGSLLKILAALDCYQKMWAIHKSGPEFELLLASEKEKVLLVGYFLKIFRKQILWIIKCRIRDFDYQVLSSRMEQMKLLAIQSRLDRWSSISNFLSKDTSGGIYQHLIQRKEELSMISH